MLLQFSFDIASNFFQILLWFCVAAFLNFAKENGTVCPKSCNKLANKLVATFGGLYEIAAKTTRKGLAFRSAIIRFKEA
jgi:hypothetical protein